MPGGRCAQISGAACCHRSLPAPSPPPLQVQLHDNAGAVSVESGGGNIQLFLSPGAVGSLRLRNAGHVAARPGTVRLAVPQDDGSLLFHLPLGLGPAAGSQPVAGLGVAGASVVAAAGARQQQAQPVSRLQRSAAAQQQPQQQAGRPPPGNAVTSAGRSEGGADILVDAGMVCTGVLCCAGGAGHMAPREATPGHAGKGPRVPPSTQVALARFPSRSGAGWTHCGTSTA